MITPTIVPDQHSRNSADRVEGLGEVEPPHGAFGIAKLSDQRIGSRLKKGEPAGDDKESQQEQVITSDIGGGPEKESSRAVEQQPSHQAELIATALHHHRRGNGEGKVTDIECRLHQAGLQTLQLEGLHELADEHVVQVVGDSPQQEQSGDQKEGHRTIGGNQRFAAVLLCCRRKRS